jgi:hypothetical protein
MKNLKNMVAAASLMAVMVFGAVSANAGMLNSDSTANATKGQCTVKSGGILQDLAGIINGLTGINIFDAPTPVCTETEGVPTANRVRWS